MHPKVQLGDEAQVEACDGTYPTVPLGERTIILEIISEILLILTQDRCTVCVECTIGLEIVLDTPDGTLR